MREVLRLIAKRFAGGDIGQRLAARTMRASAYRTANADRTSRVLSTAVRTASSYAQK